MLILFQGDSITDAGRDRDKEGSLGNGYAKLVAEMLTETYPDEQLEFINKGCSGDRAINLVGRWQEDCIDYDPDIVSILIGINDTARAMDSDDPTSAEDFEQHYRNILNQIKENTDAKILILEQFLLINAPEKDKWLDDISAKIAVSRRLAREFADAYVPLDGIFAGASVYEKPSYWADDGVHPTEHGIQVIARNYVHAVRRLIAEIA